MARVEDLIRSVGFAVEGHVSVVVSYSIPNVVGHHWVQSDFVLRPGGLAVWELGRVISGVWSTDQ